jgi:hypothetical protein
MSPFTALAPIKASATSDTVAPDFYQVAVTDWAMSIIQRSTGTVLLDLPFLAVADMVRAAAPAGP